MFHIDLIHWLFLLTTFRLILGGVFLTSAISKVSKIYNFELTIKAYKLAPESWSRLIAVFIIFAETIIAVLLLADWEIQLAAIASSFLLVIFIIAISLNLLRKNNNLECGCFGQLYSSRININHIWLNLGLLFLSSFIVLWDRNVVFIDISFLNRMSIKTVILPFAISVFGLYILFLLLKRFYYIMQVTLKLKEEK